MWSLTSISGLSDHSLLLAVARGISVSIVSDEGGRASEGFNGVVETGGLEISSLGPVGDGEHSCSICLDFEGEDVEEFTFSSSFLTLIDDDFIFSSSFSPGGVKSFLFITAFSGSFIFSGVETRD